MEKYYNIFICVASLLAGTLFIYWGIQGARNHEILTTVFNMGAGAAFLTFDLLKLAGLAAKIIKSNNKNF